METSKSRELLERSLNGKNYLNPDNHDEVHIAASLLGAESAEKVANAMDRLSQNLIMIGGRLDSTIKEETQRTIDSNMRTAQSNERYTRWNIIVAIGLVLVGLLQAWIIWKTSKSSTENPKTQNLAQLSNSNFRPCSVFGTTRHEVCRFWYGYPD
jgi:nitrogen regulatory protein PII-like uncharacterized protein